MDYQHDLEPPASDVHRFFPEWADRPESADRLLEADHNSYLAGGYSEEFGYRVRPGLAAVFQPLDGDPDQSRQWGVEIGGLHPGYPECARPADRDALRWEFQQPRAGASADQPSRHEGVGRVLRMDRSGANRRLRLLTPIGALWLRLRIRARGI